MKKSIFLSAFAAIALMSCDYNAQFDGLDTDVIPTDVKALEYTMTADDYAAVASNAANKTLAGDDLASALAAVKSQQAFSLDITAAQYAPAFLAAKWPTADNGSAVQLTYDAYGALSEEVTAISAGKLYSIAKADYESLWGEGTGVNTFGPSYPAATSIPAILNAKFEDADPGSVRWIDYKEADVDPVVSVIAIDENFNQFTETEYVAAVDGWYNVTTKGTYYWSGRYYAGENNGYVQSSAFKHEAGELESYFISKPFAVRKGMTFSFRHAYRNFTKAGGRVEVLIAEDFVESADSATLVANANAATWVDVSANFDLAEPAETKSNSLAAAGEMLLDDYEGKKIVIAFRYRGDSSQGMTSTAQIDDVYVGIKGNDSGEEPVITDYSALYQFDGSEWSVYDKATLMDKEVFEQLGLSYDNFSSSAAPENYIPQWLTSLYPYAQDGKSITLAYKYYTGGVTTPRADEYTFTAGEWVRENALETYTDQFVKQNGRWTFNPSVTLNLLPVKNEEVAKAHYQAVVDWVWENVDVPNGIANKGDGYVTSYGNNEYYTGSSAYYNNVDMRPAKAREQYPTEYETMSDEEVTALMTERLQQCWSRGLERMYPDAAPIEGIDVIYTVNLGIYTGTQLTGCTHTMQYKVVEKGKFEYVAGSFKVIE